MATETAKRRITLERTYTASLQDVWDMWTTKEGIESWWGPDGFSVKVRKLDLRPGGECHYGMTATAAPQIEFMKKHGMPLTTEAKLTYTEVSPPRRLAYMHLADFIPGVEPYEVEARLMLTPLAAESVRVDLQIDAMHNEFYTSMATQGWEMEMGKLAAIIESRRKS